MEKIEPSSALPGFPPRDANEAQDQGACSARQKLVRHRHIPKLFFFHLSWGAFGLCE